MKGEAPPPRWSCTLARVVARGSTATRAEAEAQVRSGQVAVNGRVVLDIHAVVDPDIDDIRVAGQPLATPERHYIMLNKPRGLVTTRSDEQGRETVYRCLEEPWLQALMPVGRLDKASEGLLLFSSDSRWSSRVADPSTGPAKRYHVQVAGLLADDTLDQLRRGVHDPALGLLCLDGIVRLRGGHRHEWLEVTLKGGRNRHIRRMLDAVGHPVLRLVRVAIGAVLLGDLPKGRWRSLEAAEIAGLAAATPSSTGAQA